MAKVVFLTDQITIDVPEGTKLSEAVVMAGSSLPFGCRMGSCGTCRCVVAEGIQNVNELTEAENDLFDTLTSVGTAERLACQLIIQGDIAIRH